MISTSTIREVISMILLFGTLISASFVLVGGSMLLIKDGDRVMSSTRAYKRPYPATVKKIWHEAKAFSRYGIIEFGLFLLILTQLLRVALLAIFYISSRDYWFTAFTTFILVALIASLAWHQ